MDQIKIGVFIAELRKEKQYTQKELAGMLNVSDRAISKWERGKGLPDTSLMLPLCEALDISVNELLSGERFLGENYRKRAENTIINLVRENSSNRKKGWIRLLWCALGFLLAAWWLIFSMGKLVGGASFYIDIPSFLAVLFIMVVSLASAGLFKAFFKAVPLAVSECGKLQDIIEAHKAVKLGAKSLLAGGFFVSLLTCIALLGTNKYDEYALSASFAVAFISLLYGVGGYLLLLPLQIRLEYKKEVWK